MQTPAEIRLANFKNILMETLDEMCMTPRDLAEEAHIHISTVDDLLAGRIHPSIKVLIRIGDALNVTPDLLLGYLNE